MILDKTLRHVFLDLQDQRHANAHFFSLISAVQLNKGLVEFSTSFRVSRMCSGLVFNILLTSVNAKGLPSMLVEEMQTLPSPFFLVPLKRPGKIPAVQFGDDLRIRFDVCQHLPEIAYFGENAGFFLRHFSVAI